MKNLGKVPTQQRIEAHRTHLEANDLLAAGGVAAMEADDKNDAEEDVDSAKQKLAIGKIRFQAHVEAKLVDLQTAMNDSRSKAEEAVKALEACGSVEEPWVSESVVKACFGVDHRRDAKPYVHPNFPSPFPFPFPSPSSLRLSFFNSKPRRNTTARHALNYNLKQKIQVSNAILKFQNNNFWNWK